MLDNKNLRLRNVFRLKAYHDSGNATKEKQSPQISQTV